MSSKGIALTQDARWWMRPTANTAAPRCPPTATSTNPSDTAARTESYSTAKSTEKSMMLVRQKAGF
ncbi:hypothetical protein AJ80_02558 [Polytolypa hystricis UAMH7299]|uniref:Uncharacterized protein n=1 Tax=Polytolypa hystricis (strain UAMH7299) TaxID=1447883 RepID=A0A2B7YRE4_POLH7|nr:hypothetical protein AJ80_02558 [Polytolypa hystricis UAMH7299]